MQKEFILPNAEMRNNYLPSQSSGKDQSYKQYIELLISKGLQINPKCFPSYFKLRNGLPYPGIATKQQINHHEVLVRMPKQLIINAFMVTQRPELQQIFKQNFYHQDWAWQDRVLNTYLLYIYGIKQTDNIWYHMVCHLSKDINIIAFWPEQDLDKFKDLTVKSAAQLDKQTFEQQWQQFVKIQQKYQILQHPVFTKQNYRWIFIHIMSRCFGKKLQFTSMVPFCQFFNHHSVDGLYDVEKDQNKQKDQQIQVKDLQNQNEQTQSVTTLGSQLNEDFIQIGQYDYDELQFKPVINESKSKSELNPQQKKQIKDLKQSILNSIQNNLSWEDLTILFVPFLIERCNLFYIQYKTGRKTYKKAYEDLKNLEQSVNLYRQNLISAYKKWKGKKFLYICPANKKQQPKKTLTVYTTQKKQGQNGQPNYIQFPNEEKKSYKNFLLLTGKKYIYKPNNQVYFSYGPNPNLTLLLRYGFVIQGNKHEYVSLSFDIGNALMHFPDTIIKLEKKHLSLRRKFKIKFNRLNMDLIMFFRLNSWSYFGKASVEELFKINDYEKQIAILIQLKQSLEFKLQQFEGPYDLTDPQLSYNDYFINVYHQQKQKIIKQHIQFMVSIINFLKSLYRGTDIQKAKDQFTPQQKFILRNYLSEF